MTAPDERTFRFTAPLKRVGSLYAVPIPERVSRAIGRRGNVPVVAVVNRVTEVRASLVPTGGGRHRLGLNGETRRAAEIELGDTVRVELREDTHPEAEPVPDDLASALDEAGVAAVFGAMPVGMQNHILAWINKAAREPTRAKRVAKTVEVALARREGRTAKW